MAQGSNALREPTTDEILTSIREIIEENTGRLNRQSGENVSGVKGREEVNRNVLADQKNENQDALTIDDAMRALAARIGLRQTNQVNSANQREEIAGNKEPSEKQPFENFGISGQNEGMLNTNSAMTNHNNEFATSPNAEQFSNTNINAAPRGEDPHVDVKFGPNFWTSVDLLAEQTLRPILVEWLQERWPALVEKILHEEIVHAFDRNFPSDKK